jgi:hypothetical protein
MNHRRIIIGALSARQYPERRRRCRETWFEEARQCADVEAVFLIGAAGEVSRPVLVDDLLLLPCPNDYAALPQRTRWFCQWAIENRSFEYLFKCDDDTFVCLDRLVGYQTRRRDYIGAEWRPGVGYASGGAGYFLSRRAAEWVAGGLAALEGAEDKMVGDVLHASGIALAIEDRFTPYGNYVRRPTGENQVITAHAVSGDLFSASAITKRRTVSTQAAIWRRDRLLRLLQVCGDADVATFEKQASDWTFDFGALGELFCQVDLREPLSSST